jgi:hypothetical protein
MKATDMLSQIKTLLNINVSLAQQTLENGTVIEAESFEAGQSVFIVTEDEKVALPIGEYALEDGKILVIEEEGVIASIQDSEVEAEDKEDEKVETEDEAKEEQLEEVEVEVPEAVAEIAPAVEEIVEAVVEVMAPVIEEVKAQVEELKKRMDYEEDEEKKKEEMAAQAPARKKIKHNPEGGKSKAAQVFYSQNKATSVFDKVLSKLQ